MKGVQEVNVSNRYAQYKFSLYRNITIVCGESGTGKTTLYNMIADHTRNKEKSGVTLQSTAPCIALTDVDWKNQLQHISESIVFIDEDSGYVSSVEFAEAVKASSNYYVIFNRESLHNLPYSVNEIYKIHSSKKFHSFKKMYPISETNEFMSSKRRKTKYAVILTEDTNSGFQFFDAVAKESAIACESAAGNSNVFFWLKDNMNKKIFVIVDGAAFGAEMGRVTSLIKNSNDIRLYLPESFEWIILKSGLIEGTEVILDSPSEYIESEKFLSWERYFAFLLDEKTRDDYLTYKKTKLNACYLNPKEKAAILNVLPEAIRVQLK